MFVSLFGPRILSEKEKLFVSVPAISVCIRSVFIYHYSKKKYNVCIPIRSENSFRERKIICICTRNIRLYPIRFHPYSI
jgi:hypothetical protein